jgi:Insertion element 4 transposase N-terminal
VGQTESVAGGRLTDWISLGVLASWVPADAVDDAVDATGKNERRRGGKLPPRVVAYLVMALALFADEDYEEVAARLAGTFADWDGWEESWDRTPTSGGITQEAAGRAADREKEARVRGHRRDADRHRPGRRGPPVLLRET